MRCKLIGRCTAPSREQCYNNGTGCGILRWWEAPENSAPSGTLDLIVSCPFCGNKTPERHLNDIAQQGNEMGTPNSDSFYIHCDGCGADGPIADSEGESVERWNKRL